ncbi:protein sld2 [Aspergillus glaucus CBS 516.65]|uniref:DNA replication regulator SLD2 n=1 Tax=Aspergillus glaucus CBS 516.65 TaxID=1160497 RepID=A0A1L9V720_ASPGL|nr:hypothetical protein ASPGLDRAFT_39558 [Aspergillus glaucus CBS 516.65]OJJ79701.1 hypothetical protein ASPGLDRAFT_39558 [Aspergillus glaucus CBS 516.65]
MATATLAATDLRAELKEWERAFSAANGGRKAGRHDIKNNPDIAAKYKAYGRMKALESAADKDTHHDQNESTLEERPKKRKHTSPTGPGHEQSDAATPRKSNKGIFATPSRPRTNHPADIDPYDSPSVLRRLFSPSTHQQSTPLKAAVGPTPQRDGKALGLFDLLSESGGSTATPSAARIASLEGAAVQTPSRRNRMETIAEEDEEEEEEEEENPRGGRTPVSSGKKLYLENLFATPTTMKYAAMVEDEEDRRPTGANVQAAAAAASANRRVAGPGETPSFLRRSNAGRSFNVMDPSTGGLSPIAARKPPQFVGKGLSALVQGLRDMEEERMEDDMDVLRELEAEQDAMDNPEVDVQGSQAGGAGRKPYKKKGQKRTTRRVRMKPVVVPKARTKLAELSGDEEDEQAAIPETQFQQTENHFSEDDDADDASLHSISERELEDSDSDPDFDEPVTKTKSFAEKMKEAISADSKNNPQESSQSSEKAKEKAEQKEKEKKDKEKEESAKPRPRKVNPEAHANYRSLNIRNKNTKGRGAGRFRRR